MQTQYDDIGARYEAIKSLTMCRYVERPAMESLMRGLEGRTVLDVGCGTGYYSRMARQAGARRVVGVDNSAEMVQAAEAAEAGDPTGAEYVHAPSEAVPTIGSFDVVLAIYLLNYAATPDALRAMTGQLVTNLAPGGEVRVWLARPEFDFHRDGPPLVKYGLHYEPEPGTDGEFPRGTTIAATEPEIRFSAYIVSRDAVVDSFAAAGLHTLDWSEVTVDDAARAAFDASFWDEFEIHRPWATIRATR